MNGNVVFYKDNFIYDDNLISESLQFLNEISKELLIEKFDIYFGKIVDQNFAFDYHYGRYENGNIIKE